MKQNVLVVDIGGTHVKLLMSTKDKLKFDSGPDMTPRDFVRKFHETTAKLKFANAVFPFCDRFPINDTPREMHCGYRLSSLRAAIA